MRLQQSYILERGDVTVTAAGAKQVAFKNCALFTKCNTKIDGITINDAEHLDLVMPMYKLTEYSSNYSGTTDHLWFYSKYEATGLNWFKDFKFFKYKAKLLRNIVADGANGILKKCNN